MSLTPRLTALGVVSVLLAGAFAAPASAAPTTVTRVAAATADPAAVTLASTYARTSALEHKRVDSVKTPKLAWYKCYDWAQCATARVPLDYDQPNGKTTELALLRVKATNQKAKIGSLFVNPGGPGGAATDLALAAPLFLSDSLLERFDIVGVDPRGIGASKNLKCFRSTGAQNKALAGLNTPFPYGAKQEKSYVASVKALGKACSTTGKTVAGAMSTAEVARDMDVMRRAVGDKKLTYLGFSYGTAIGQYYANMFPDRFRALAVDGVINPVSWVGTSKTRNIVQDDRLRSADGAYKALMEVLKRCDRAGIEYCEFADGDPVARFATISRRLKVKPLVLGVDVLGTIKLTYPDFVAAALSALYSPDAGDGVTMFAQSMWILTSTHPSDSTEVVAAKAVVGKRITAMRAAGRDFPYDNTFESASGVLCTDGLHPKSASLWPSLTAKSDKRAPYFGRLWAWSTAQCARDTWTVRDEDAYKGPFNRRTAATVLVVGSYWDPATNYKDAVSSAKLLPNSRLLSSNNFGHTAYGTGACATGVIDKYLLRGTLPAKGAVCKDAVQPFLVPLESDESVDDDKELFAASKNEIAAMGLPGEGASKILPPLVGRVTYAGR
jgi:pimeloyl-ACP methyl ester carboxylesterase